MDIKFVFIGECYTGAENIDLTKISKLLADYNFNISELKVFPTSEITYEKIRDEAISSELNRYSPSLAYVIVGDPSAMKSFFDRENEESNYFLYRNRLIVTDRECNENFVRNTLIPLLNYYTKSVYNVIVIKVFGLTVARIREKVTPFVKNKNKIKVRYYADGLNCNIRISYARNINSTVLNETIENINAELKDYIYAYGDKELPMVAAELLLRTGKRLSIAESFTGGGVASALIAKSGMSSALIESIVCYSNESKVKRLNIPERIINNHGAVSVDTAFEMANGLLSNPKCDIAIATTGNAGPTSEKPEQVGLFYIAIGDRQTIHVYENYRPFEDESLTDDVRRMKITKTGIETALFELQKYLKRM